MREIIPHHPEAVFAASDTMAVGALRALREAGLRVPEDVALAGFDGSRASETTSPPLTTVLQDVHRTGEQAVDVLNRVIDDPSAAPIVQVEPVELVVRASTGGGTTSIPRSDRG